MQYYSDFADYSNRHCRGFRDSVFSLHLLLMLYRLLLFLVIPHLVFAQKAASLPDSCAKRRKTFLLLAGGGYAAGMSTLGYAWYRQQGMVGFSFFNDAPQWMGMDKAGHAFTAFYLAENAAVALRQLCYSPQEVRNRSALLSWAAMLPIEILDGFSPAYGFSWADAGANLSGAFLYWLQSRQGQVVVRPKYSFHPSPYAALRPEVLGNSISEQWLKDYNGQTYWLSFDWQAVFLRRPLPLPITLAAGYGAEEMVYARREENLRAGFRPYAQLYFSIDMEWSRVPTSKPWLRTAFRFLNMIKIPAPALAWDERHGWQWHWLYF